MSYLDLTVLNDFQATTTLTNEKFIARYGMIQQAKDNMAKQNYIPPSVIDQLRTITGNRAAQIPVIKDQTVVTSTTPSFTIPANLAETDLYSFTPYDVFSGFRIYPSTFEDNMEDGVFYRNEVLKNVLQAMAVVKDDIIETQLEARKTQTLSYTTQISQGDGTFTFNAGTDTLEISKAAQKDTMFYNLRELMQANQLPGEYSMVLSPAALATNEAELLKFGANNSENKAWDRPFNAYYSDQISPSTDVFRGFLVRDGALGIMSNYPWDFRNKTTLAGKEWDITDVEMPFIMSRPNVFINKEATDATALVSSGNSNAIMTHFEEIAIWDRFYVVYRYNSDLTTRQNDIVKIKGLTT